MMAHLDKIERAAESIAAYAFTPPGLFTNAVLSKDPPTRLIRDIAPSERALFTLVDGTPAASKTHIPAELKRPPGEATMEAYLQAVEKLNAIYPSEGVADRVAGLWMQRDALTASIEVYERQVDQQRLRLEAMAVDDDIEGDVTGEMLQREQARVEALEVQIQAKQEELRTR